MNRWKRAPRFGTVLILIVALILATCACSQDVQRVEGSGKVEVKSSPARTEEPTPEAIQTTTPVAAPVDPRIEEAMQSPQEAGVRSAEQSPLPSGSPSASVSPQPTQTPMTESAMPTSSPTSASSQSIAGDLTSGFDSSNIAVLPTRALPTGQDPQPTQEPVNTGDGFFGTFEVQDLDGNSYTNDLFAENDLTVVNVMATWCSSCISEMPALQALPDSLSDSNVAVVGIVTDTSQRGTVNQNAVSTAKQIKDSTGVTYPLLIPDSAAFNGALDNVVGYPTTFFIGKDGQQVASPVVGALDRENWQRTVSEILSQLNN